MRKIPIRGGESVVRTLVKNGFVVRRHNGSHVILEKDGRVVVVPVHGSKDISIGTMNNIIRKSGVSSDEF